MPAFGDDGLKNRLYEVLTDEFNSSGVSFAAFMQSLFEVLSWFSYGQSDDDE